MRGGVTGDLLRRCAILLRHIHDGYYAVGEQKIPESQ